MSAPTTNDPSYYLTRKFLIRKDELMTALFSSEFYIELGLIAASLALAWLVAALVRRRVSTHL